MRHYRLCNLLSFLLALFLVVSSAGTARAGSGGHEKEVNGYLVRLIFQAHPKTGNNPIQIHISDPHGQPLQGAKVEIQLVQAEEEHGHAEAEDDHSEEQTAPADAHAEMPAAETGHETLPGMDMSDHSAAEMSAHGDMSAPSSETGAHAEPEVEAASGGHDEPEAAHAETGGHGPSGKLKPAREIGLYAGKALFTKAGNWSIQVSFSTPDGSTQEELDFLVDVIDAGPNWPLILGFFGINLSIIVAAVILKPRTAVVKA